MSTARQAILCVDDEKTVLQCLKTQLKRHFGQRYRYETAESAEEAWEVIEELAAARVDILIIVADWLMPGIKGDEFLIRVHQRFPGIVTVLLTGQAAPEAIERARREAGLHRCLFKPWEERELIETIASGLPES